MRRAAIYLAAILHAMGWQACGEEVRGTEMQDTFTAIQDDGVLSEVKDADDIEEMSDANVSDDGGLEISLGDALHDIEESEIGRAHV